MNRLIYIANNRLPTEKAHGLQIVQMCEALADSGYDVTLVTARRRNTPAMHAVRNLWDYYGVARNFALRRLPCLDLIDRFPARWQRLPFMLQTITYLLVLWVWLLPRRADVLYTRDAFAGFMLALLRPLLWRRAQIVYEVHQVRGSRLGERIQRFVARRAVVVAITGHLAQHMRDLGATRVLVAHDGIRAARFADLPARDEARAALGIAADAFVVGYIGRLHTMGMSKGLDTLIDAIAQAAQDGPAIELLLVGGPQAGVDTLRQQWAAHGLSPDRLHAVGQVTPDEVPCYLAAMDVGAMSLPWTTHFAYYASAIKLFEYMAAGCAVLASDLPSTAEVVQDGETARLVPPGDVAALAGAIRELATDPAMVRWLGAQAQAEAQHYTWDARAARIRSFVGAEERV
jgi:glycosyltransferase involved in cell wall biosynthesis